MERGAFRIMLPLREILIVIRIARRDRVVVADRAVAVEQSLQDLLAVRRELQRETDVVVVVGRLVGLHGEHGVPPAGRAHDFDLRRLHHQRDGLRVDAVDGVKLPGNQAVQAR
jgi:hypothetical protein